MSFPIDLSVLAISPDRDNLEEDLESTLVSLIEGGITAFMFREKRLEDQDFLSLGIRLKEICDSHGVAFILNERTELAEPMGACVVHLTWRSSQLTAPSKAGPILFGRSVHSMSEAMDAVSAGVDYLVAGPVFPTLSKEGLVETIGLSGLTTMCANVDLPIAAVGGIKSSSLSSIYRTGAVGACGISCFFDVDEPKIAAAEFRKVWEASYER